jgi:hypothetical protein
MRPVQLVLELVLEAVPDHAGADRDHDHAGQPDQPDPGRLGQHALGGVLLGSGAAGRGAGHDLAGGEGQGQVDDHPGAGRQPLGDAGLALLVAVADGGEQRLPDRQPGQADDHDDQHDLAERLLGDLLEGARLVALGTGAAECDLDGQIGDQRVQDAVADEAEAG